MKRFLKAVCFVLIVCTVATVIGCGKTPAPQTNENNTLVVGTLNFDGKFSPFFSTNSYENDVLALVHLPLLGIDREGAVVTQGIGGETRALNGTNYTYRGIADCEITENEDGTVFYDFTLKEGVRFSDGTEMDIDDVIFSLYVPLDPTYDGTMTLYSLPIAGLEAYRSGMQSRIELILQAGDTGYTQTEFFTKEQYDTFWTAYKSVQKLPQEEQGAALEAALGERIEEFTLGMETGQSAPNVSGIQKTGDMSLRVVLTEVSATAIYTLATTIVPMHYYGQEELYDYENNQFGFVKGDLSHVRSVTTKPMGAGPYTFQSYRGGTVTLQANENYWKGKPNISYIQYKEGQDADKVSGVVAGTLDISDPSYSVETAKAISAANGGTISGDVLTSNMVANLGYGYVGFNAKNVNVAGDGGSEASKNLRKAIATMISVYRDVAVDSYYGEYANVINYPISDTSWAAPRVSDEGYQVAFSTDVDGNPIYTGDMTAQQRYDAAKKAALDYFQRAGYTIENGKVTAAPQGAAMSYEVLVGAGGTGDHPTFMALSLASQALKELGFNLIVTDISNFAELTNAVNGGTAEMFALAWGATPDPDLFQVYHSEGGSNEKSYFLKDEQLDNLIMLARQSTDRDYRKVLYKKCLEIINDWAVEIPMYQRKNVVIFSTQRVDISTLTPDMTTFWGWENDIELLKLRG